LTSNVDRGAVTATTSATGRIRTPACNGVKPRSNCRNCVCTNSAPNNANTPSVIEPLAAEKRRDR
jgi:hypothetical protein